MMQTGVELFMETDLVCRAYCAAIGLGGLRISHTTRVTNDFTSILQPRQETNENANEGELFLFLS